MSLKVYNHASYHNSLNHSVRIRLAVKINDEYRDYKDLPPALLSQQGPVGPSRPAGPARKMITVGGGTRFLP